MRRPSTTVSAHSFALSTQRSPAGGALTERPVAAPEKPFSLLDDPLLRVQRALRLAPRNGLGAVRRAVLYALGAWLPLVAWAAANGFRHVDSWHDAILQHLEVHVRCLLAIPLFVLSGPLADRIIGAIIGNFPTSDLLRPEDRSAFDAGIRRAERWRDSWLVWSLLIGVTALITVLGADQPIDPASVELDQSTAAFAIAWARFVVRPVFMLMLLAWLWRLVLTGIMFRGIAKLDLQLVPSHPDRVGGLGFVQLQPAAFSLVVFTLSAVVCAAAGQQMVERQLKLSQFQSPLIALVVILVLLFLAPLSAFGSALRRTRLRGRFQYGTLAGRHVRGLHRRWVEGVEVKDDGVMQAPEIGPAADVATLYDLATRMRPLPIGMAPLLAVLVPAMLPILPVATLEIPLKDILSKVLGMLS
jgi:hypothetical protein